MSLGQQLHVIRPAVGGNDQIEEIQDVVQAFDLDALMGLHPILSPLYDLGVLPIGDATRDRKHVAVEIQQFRNRPADRPINSRESTGGIRIDGVVPVLSRSGERAGAEDHNLSFQSLRLTGIVLELTSRIGQIDLIQSHPVLGGVDGAHAGNRRGHALRAGFGREHADGHLAVVVGEGGLVGDVANIEVTAVKRVEVDQDPSGRVAGSSGDFEGDLVDLADQIFGLIGGHQLDVRSGPVGRRNQCLSTDEHDGALDTGQVGQRSQVAVVVAERDAEVIGKGHLGPQLGGDATRVTEMSQEDGNLVSRIHGGQVVTGRICHVTGDDRQGLLTGDVGLGIEGGGRVAVYNAGGLSTFNVGVVVVAFRDVREGRGGRIRQRDIESCHSHLSELGAGDVLVRFPEPTGIAIGYRRYLVVGHAVFGGHRVGKVGPRLVREGHCGHTQHQDDGENGQKRYLKGAFLHSSTPLNLFIHSKVLAISYMCCGSE